MKETSKRDWDNATYGEFKSALKELKENPINHNFSDNEVEKILEFEKSFEKFNTPTPTNLAFIAKMEASLKRIKDGMDIYQKAISFNLKNLVSLGWYISPTILGELKLGEAYDFTKKTNVNNFETYIYSQADYKLSQYLDEITLAYPERKHIFEEMKLLYKNKCFISFVTLCYSQVDGISNDKWNQGFFNTDNKNNYVLTLPYRLNFKPSSVADAIGRQLKEPRNEFTIGSATFDNQAKRYSYNRHLVIHGQSINYGTKENAIRALLLLEFVKWLSIQDNNNN